MQILRETHFDFMKYRRFWIAVSFLTIALGIGSIFFLGQLNLGIDFAGGTQLTLRFRQRPDIQELRDLVSSAGFREAQIQRFGGEDQNEVMIRTSILAGSEEGSAAQVLSALNERFNPEASGRPDLNLQGRDAIASLLANRDPDGVGAAAADAHYAALAEAIGLARRDLGLFTSWDQVVAVPGVSAKASAALRETASLGGFALLASENVGPQVGAELRQRGILAVVFSLIGMLIYIWVRFELRFGIGATMASLHDVLITLGIYALMGYEFNLTTIAAFLTLVGYSVNDTVVTFDRVRENMRKSRGQKLIDLLNRSLNQMLSRTLLTGGTTVVAAMMLWLFGGEAIKGFAFIIMVGIVVGTYSSIYIASPFALLWERMFGKERGSARPVAPSKPVAKVTERAGGSGKPGVSEKAARRAGKR